jgi:hypothetical protein
VKYGRGWDRDRLQLSLLSEWQVDIEKPELKPGERLDFCPRCTRLLAVGSVVYRHQNVNLKPISAVAAGFTSPKESRSDEVENDRTGEV